MYERPEITVSQKAKLAAYLDEVCSSHMHKMYVAIAGTILFLIPGIIVLAEFIIGADKGFDASYFRENGYFLAWIVSVGALVYLFLTGYQRKFGKNSLVNRVRRGEYTCEYIIIAQISDIQGKPPYLLLDTLGNQYVVPNYLECKQMRIGMRAVGLYVDDICLAMLDPALIPQM